MPKRLQDTLGPDRALIFRITHRSNVPWILANGLCCSNGKTRDPNFVTIGNPDLIAKRTDHPVPIPPGGTLGDYIPFYFTPYSPMLLNIRTGYGGIRRRNNDEIAILVSSLPRLVELGVGFLFTDRHAYLRAARFSGDLSELDLVDWELLRARDFSRDPENPEKIERYQAEALVHRQMPPGGLLTVACFDDQAQASIAAAAAALDLEIDIVIRRGWYFT
jgi:hypothetical protein